MNNLYTKFRPENGSRINYDIKKLNEAVNYIKQGYNNAGMQLVTKAGSRGIINFSEVNRKTLFSKTARNRLLQAIKRKLNALPHKNNPNHKLKIKQIQNKINNIITKTTSSIKNQISHAQNAIRHSQAFRKKILNNYK